MVNVLSPDHFLVARRKLPSLDNEANNRSLAKQTGVPRLACLLAASKDQPDTQPESIGHRLSSGVPSKC